MCCKQRIPIYTLPYARPDRGHVLITPVARPTRLQLRLTLAEPPRCVDGLVMRPPRLMRRPGYTE